MKKITPEYLAGVIDSDGSMSITKRHIKRPNPNYTCMVQLTWTHNKTTEKFMTRLQKQYGGSYFIGNRGSFKNSKDTIKYCATGNAAEKMILDIKNFLILKPKQAANLLKVRRLTGVSKSGPNLIRPAHINKRLERLYLNNKKLNSKNG